MMVRSRSLVLLYHGPLVAWMAVVFVFSTSAGRDAHSSSLIMLLLKRLTPEFADSLTTEQRRALNFAFRKTGHVAEYFVLMALAVRAFQFGRADLSFRAAAGALALTLGYATTDELHQRFVPGRSAMASDVMVDSVGALAALVVTLVWFRLKSLERRLWEHAPRPNRLRETAP